VYSGQDLNSINKDKSSLGFKSLNLVHICILCKINRIPHPGTSFLKYNNVIGASKSYNIYIN
jgi:hypothetical protein